MKLLEAIEQVREFEHALLIYDELLAFLEKLPSGEVDLPLPEGESLSAAAVGATRQMLQKGRSETEELAAKIRGLDVVEPKKRRRSRSTAANKRPGKTASKSSN